MESLNKLTQKDIQAGGQTQVSIGWLAPPKSNIQGFIFNFSEGRGMDPPTHRGVGEWRVTHSQNLKNQSLSLIPVLM